MLIYKTETLVKTKLQLVVYFCWERQISGESGPIHFIKAKLLEIFISTAHQAYTCKVELETKVHVVYTITEKAPSMALLLVEGINPH